MVGKRVQFDDETWETIQEVARQRGRTFQQLADEACGASARRYGQPVPKARPGILAESRAWHSFLQRVPKGRDRHARHVGRARQFAVRLALSDYDYQSEQRCE
jgi:hypothetical protein